MGIIRITLEDEHGKVVEEAEGDPHVLDSLLPLNDRSYQCLRFVDPYGDTVFNWMQMEQFLIEWNRLSNKAKTMEQKHMMNQVNSLAIRCQNEPHRYLKFYGD